MFSGSGHTRASHLEQGSYPTSISCPLQLLFYLILNVYMLLQKALQDLSVHGIQLSKWLSCREILKKSSRK